MITITIPKNWAITGAVLWAIANYFDFELGLELILERLAAALKVFL